MIVFPAIDLKGGQVVRLLGGVAPLYAAIAFDGEHEVYGLGFSAQAAKRALLDAGVAP